MCSTCGILRSEHNNVYHKFESSIIFNFENVRAQTNKDTKFCKLCGVNKSDHSYMLHDFA